MVDLRIKVVNDNFFYGAERVVFNKHLRGFNGVNAQLHFVWVRKGPFLLEWTDRKSVV